MFDAIDPSWTVWHRRDRRSPWRLIASAETEDEAWRRLLDYPLAGDKTVAAPGRDPNAEEKRR